MSLVLSFAGRPDGGGRGDRSKRSYAGHGLHIPLIECLVLAALGQGRKDLAIGALVAPAAGPAAWLAPLAPLGLFRWRTGGAGGAVGVRHLAYIASANLSHY